MNRQEVFDTVKNHLLTQNATSAIGGVCAYRGENGLRCAIGCLIPDSLYCVSYEGIRVSSPEIYDLLGIEIKHRTDIMFLCELQIIHDIWDPIRWPRKLRELALKHGLRWI